MLDVPVAPVERHLTAALRKRLYLEHFSNKPWEAQAITLADKIDNFQSIIVCARVFAPTRDPWAMFKRGRDAQVGRFRDLLERTRALAPHALIDEYATVLAEVESL